MILVIGGTGTLGKAFIKKRIAREKIICLSRCELKQKELQAEIKSENLQCILGDIRDKEGLRRAFRMSPHEVYHFAALKHIDVMEYNPEECIKTNILGTVNVADLCDEYNVKKVLFSSTDKATDPINVYGQSKAVSEKLLLKRGPRYYVTRWGNIAGSRGSILPHFVQLLKERKPIPITDIRMTRFWMKIEDAVNFIDLLMTIKKTGGLYIPDKVKAAAVVDVVHALARIIGVDKYNFKTIGLRPGEKIHERLHSEHNAEGPLQSDDKAITFSSRELTEFLRPIVRSFG